MKEHLFQLICQLEEIKIAVEAMKAANLERERKGEALAYSEDAFRKLIGDIDDIRVRIGG